MEALNAAGRRVSLLNDDDIPRQHCSYTTTMSHAYPTPSSAASSVASSAASSPSSPPLWRSGSYDSQMSDAVSPLTPVLDYIYYNTSSQPPTAASNTKPPPLHYSTSSRSTSNNDDDIPMAPAGQDRPAKRYPCRFRDSHGCEKTFTTSGHASRHSKIHTAEKAVHCTFAGCQKKFTRADNMKQHLETHYKDKSCRATATATATAPASSHRAAAHKSAAAHERRPVSTARSRSSSSISIQELDVRQYALPTPPSLHSPCSIATSGPCAWELNGTTLPLHTRRPAPIHTPKSGLDALAMAVACQER